MEITGLVIFIILALLGIVLIFLGMAGTASIFIGSFIYAAVTKFQKISWKLLLFLLFLAVLSELIEQILSALGAKKFGASGKSSLSVLVGGLIGGILGGMVFPIVGSLIGVILGGCLAPIIVEYHHRKELKPSLRAGLGSLVGRMGGALLKLVIAGVMIAVILTHILPLG
jgi:uncharacterized protein YqgC (DUF456 family)